MPNNPELHASSLFLSMQTLCSVILYCLLAPFDNEQSDLLHRLQRDKVLEDMPMYGRLVKVFVTQEIVSWSEFEAQFAAVLKEGTPEDPCTGIFTRNPTYWEELSKRVVEHVSALGINDLHQLVSLLCPANNVVYAFVIMHCQVQF